MAYRILCTGPESSGTRMLAALLIAAGKDKGVEVEHHTPRRIVGDKFYSGTAFDAIVLLVRNGYTTARSMVENHHASDKNRREYDLDLAYFMVPDALRSILSGFSDAVLEKTHVVTYEALIYEWPYSFESLCKDLALDISGVALEAPRNANAKYWGGEFFRDVRSLEERMDPDV